MGSFHKSTRGLTVKFNIKLQRGEEQLHRQAKEELPEDVQILNKPCGNSQRDYGYSKSWSRTSHTHTHTNKNSKIRNKKKKISFSLIPVEHKGRQQRFAQGVFSASPQCLRCLSPRLDICSLHAERALLTTEGRSALHSPSPFAGILQRHSR